MDLCTFQRYKASRVSKCEKGDFSIVLIDSLVIDAFQDPSKRLQKEALGLRKGSFMIRSVSVIFRLGIVDARSYLLLRLLRLRLHVPHPKSDHS
jgi:hypothetical protein